MKGQIQLFGKRQAKTFRLWIPMPEKHMFSIGNKTIKVLGKVWKTLFQEGFPVIT